MGSYELKQCVICDIDGTVSDPDHRRCWVDGSKEGKKYFDTFYSLMADDPPIMPMISLLNMYHMNTWPIIFCTARPESYREITAKWMADHGIMAAMNKGLNLRMRPDEQMHVPDDQIKQTMLDEILAEGWEPHIVFDDRKKVVDMWRSNGLYVHQVADGNF